jgi:hypothetical protein
MGLLHKPRMTEEWGDKCKGNVNPLRNSLSTAVFPPQVPHEVPWGLTFGEKLATNCQSYGIGVATSFLKPY